MLKSIAIENFKCFGPMQKIPIRPITLFYGPNSSGKSSILKSLDLLKAWLEKAHKHDFNHDYPRFIEACYPRSVNRNSAFMGVQSDHIPYEAVYLQDRRKILSFEFNFDLDEKNIESRRLSISAKYNIKGDPMGADITKFDINPKADSDQSKDISSKIWTYLKDAGHLSALRDEYNFDLRREWKKFPESSQKTFLEWLSKFTQPIKQMSQRYSTKIPFGTKKSRKLTNFLTLTFRKPSIEVCLPSIGKGISQVIPIILYSLSDKKLLLIEQPESQLHPALQAELGDLFIEAALGTKARKTLLIETHSEHLILRILRRIREITEGNLDKDRIVIKPEDVAILYLQPEKTGSKVIHIPITPNGEFSIPWPQGFFPERTKELF